MGREDLPPPVRAVVDENQKIMDLIKELAEKQKNEAQQDKQLQRILNRIYRNIERYGDASKDKKRVEAYVYDTWRGLLDTIKAILKLPGADFVGARMCLFLGAELISRPGFPKLYEAKEEAHKLAADEKIADLHELCTDADDVLLGALRKIWICSGQTESFDWVFTEHQIDRSYGQRDAELAAVLSLQEYKRCISERQQEERDFFSRLDGEYKPTVYKWLRPRGYPEEEGTGSGPDLTWQRMKGNAKPITGHIATTINCLDECGCSDIEINNHVHIFRRSWQFCLDAQQITEGNVGNQREELLNTILLRHRIPREIHKEISSYLNNREPFPYLKKLDIGAVYTPFPKVGGRCLECEHLDDTSAVKRTCPQKALYIWNLALRRFHAFHKNGFNQWSLCSHGSDCKGHHDCNDHSWAVQRDPEFTQFIEKEASRDNDKFLSLDQVGLGPAQHIRLSKEEDKIRDKRRFEKSLNHDEAHEDWMMTGGLGGLVDSMLHGRVLVMAWSEGQDGAEVEKEGRPREAGTMSKLPKWALGRNFYVQRAAELAITDLHSWPGRCEWCEQPGKSFFAREIARSLYFSGED
ncbi:hypothetical protein FMUND_12556 [Fusarium mundagurra]|uniref:Uncharacterized protein n=1 Tax=Fusarium mundagurra TaxID=1567541 RepID=A0A8H6D583_9HYPO|nr:hypothetical protein FMUND_12556 [Fusarium mundagurra]